MWEWAWPHHGTWSGLTVGVIKGLLWGSYKADTIRNQVSSLWLRSLARAVTRSVTHHNGARLKASRLVRTENAPFRGLCRGSPGVSATRFTAEQVLKSDAANVINPFLTASALQTMLCNTSIVSVGLLRHEAVCCASPFPPLQAVTQIVSLTKSGYQQFVVDASERNGYCLSK